MKLTQEEQELLESVERGEWQRVDGYDEQAERLQTAAKTTFRKDKRVNIRISERDLSKLQVKALEEGLPYQTLISSILHKYVSGRLVESARYTPSPDTLRVLERVRIETGLSDDELLTVIREQNVSYTTSNSEK